MSIFLQIAWNGLLAALLYALVAGALSLLHSTTKIFNFAHGATILVGAYGSWYLAEVAGFPLALAVAGACTLAGASGVLMNELVFEPLRRRGAKGVSYLIASFAILTLSSNVMLLLFGAAPRAFQYVAAPRELFGVFYTGLQVGIVGVSVALLSAFYLLVYLTRFGKAMRATADNEMVSQILGIDTLSVRRRAFFVASVLGGAAGALAGLQFNADPNMGTFLVIKGFAGAVIGGMSSFAGALVGSGLIGSLEQIIAWFLGAGWRNAITFALLFVFLLILPQGIFGSKRHV